VVNFAQTQLNRRAHRADQIEPLIHKPTEPIRRWNQQNSIRLPKARRRLRALGADRHRGWRAVKSQLSRWSSEWRRPWPRWWLNVPRPLTLSRPELKLTRMRTSTIFCI